MYLYACMKMQVASKDEIEINIDKIQPRTFHYLNNLVKSNLPEKKARYGSFVMIGRPCSPAID